MSATGFTPIQLYYSTTAAAAPSAGNLAAGELALNITDGRLFYKDNGGVVRVLATKAGASGDVVGPGSSTDNALVRFDSTTGKLVQNSAGVLDDSGNLTGIAALTTSGALTLNGGTANGVTYLNGSKVLTSGSALVFDGSNLGLGFIPSAWKSDWKAIQLPAGSLTSDGTVSINMTANAFVNSSGNRTYINSAAATEYEQYTGKHMWYTAPSGTAGDAIAFTQAMTLDASGNLLIGTTALALSNTNSALIQTTGLTCALILQHSSGNSSGTAYELFAYNGVQIGSITQAGTVGVLYNVTSDYRLKTVIGPVTDAGTRIDSLQPVEYTWNSGGSHTRGFLAHQFQEVYAGSVSGTKDAVDAEGNPVYQSMQASTAEVIADLVAEIQSLRQRLAALEAA